MSILKSTLPDNSVLKSEGNSYNYIDSFQGSFVDMNGSITPTEIGKSFFMSAPKWIDHLFTLRNKLVGVLGLKTSGEVTDKQKILNDFKCNKGEQLGLFRVFDRTDNEIVLGEDDKHLNFRISLFIENYADGSRNKNLVISTTVKFNNFWGRIYFLPVRPFHKLIVPTMLREIIRNI